MIEFVYGILKIPSYLRTDLAKFHETSIFLIELHCTARYRALSMGIDKAARVTAAVRAIPARKRRRKIKRRVEGKWKLI